METTTSYEPLRISRELVRGGWRPAVLVAVLCLLSTAATLALPLAAGELVSAIQHGGAVYWPATAMVGLSLGAACAAAFATFLVGRVGQQVIMRLRSRVMAHVLRLPLADVRREGTGDLSTRLTADSMQLKSAIDIGPVQLPMAALTVLGTMVIMGVLDSVLLLFTIASFVVAGVLVVGVTLALRGAYLDLQTVLGQLASRFIAALDALPVIKAYRAEPRISAELTASAQRAARIGVRAARIESLVIPAVNLGQQVALVTVIIGGGARLVGGHLTLATFAAFLLYLLQLAAPLFMAATSVSGLQAGLAARRRFDDLLRLPDEAAMVAGGGAASTDVSPASVSRVDPTPSRGGGAEPVPVSGAADGRAVSLHDVSFGYDDQLVLDGVSLNVPERGLTALVGPSGAGKSTLLSLVERFVVPRSGRLTVAGRDLSDWPLSELRAQLAYVDQRCTLLTDTVRANLTLGRPDRVLDEDLWAALALVDLVDPIRRLPGGLDEVLGETSDLSGGERQRLALARALLTDAKLVLLDEPSSQLDSLNEERLRQVIDRLARDRAVLVVAHRLSTVRHARQVIVLDGGRVIASGTHDDLLRTSPTYEELVRGQALAVPDQVGAATPDPAGAVA